MPSQSSTQNVRGNRASKQVSPYLCKILFTLMQMLLQFSPADDPVYQFLDRKRAESKSYHIYMNFGRDKFLRCNYDKIRDYIVTLDPSPPVESWSANEITDIVI